MQDTDEALQHKIVMEYAQAYSDAKVIESGETLQKDIKPLYGIYIRKSTKGKKHQQTSLKDHKKQCKDLAINQKLTVIGKQYIETESAHTTGKRDVFEQMIKDIENGVINSIIDWSVDRLARNMLDAGRIIELLDKGKLVDLKFPTYQFTNDGKMELGMQFVLAKLYSDNLSVTQKRGTISRVEEGKAVTRLKHIYRKSVDKHWRPDGRNYELLQNAWLMALDGKTQKTIANWMNEEGFSYAKDISKMTEKKVSDILRDPFYCGIWVVKDKIIEIKKVDLAFKAMVKVLQFNQVRELLKQKKAFETTRTLNLLFSKLVQCEWCERTMTPSKPGKRMSEVLGKAPKKRFLYLKDSNTLCHRYIDSTPHHKVKKEVRAKIVMDFIIDTLKNYLEVDMHMYEAYVKYSKDVLNQKRKELTIIRQKYVTQLGKLNKRKIILVLHRKMLRIKSRTKSRKALKKLLMKYIILKVNRRSLKVILQK